MLKLADVFAHDGLGSLDAFATRSRALAPSGLGHVLAPGDYGRLSWLVGALDEALPIPAQATAFRGDFFSRLPGHNRSFYFHTNPAPSGLTGVLVFKGCEAASQNVAAFLARLAAMPSPVPGVSLASYFPMIEGKPPLAVTLDEAQHEFDVAAHIRDQVPEARPLRLPSPLSVRVYPDAIRSRYLDAVRQTCGVSTADLVAGQCEVGLGAYTYAYPAAPVRVANLPRRPSRAATPTAFREAILSSATCRSWIVTVAHILAAGVVPVPAGAIRAGVCLDDNNAVLDGGFVDLADTVITVTPDRHALPRASAMLARTIQQHLDLAPCPDHALPRYAQVVESMCRDAASSRADLYMQADG